MAHRKAGGTAKNLRDSNPKFLGVKIHDGQKIKKGQVIVRQRGTKMEAGANVGVGRDYTLFALADGAVKFVRQKRAKFTGKKLKKVVVEVIPQAS